MPRQRLSRSDRLKFTMILNGYAYFQALAAACELDLFSYLSEQPGRQLEEITAHLGIPQYSTRVLLLSCCAMGLVKRNAVTGSYSNTAISETLLIKDSPENLLPFVKQGYDFQELGCRHLTESLKSGTNIGLCVLPGKGRTLYERMARRPQLEKLFDDGMSRSTAAQTNEAVAGLAEIKGIRHLLDVGGGTGEGAILLHRTHPHLEITVFDVPAISRVAARAIKREGLSASIHATGGDVFVDPLPARIDAVLFSHFLELFSEEKIQYLYRKVYEALPPKGKLIAWTLSCNDNETGTLQSAKSSIYFLAVASGEGMAYPAKDHERWLRAAGFSKVKRQRRAEHALIVATK